MLIYNFKKELSHDSGSSKLFSLRCREEFQICPCLFFEKALD